MASVFRRQRAAQITAGSATVRDKNPDKKKAAANNQPLIAKKYPQNNPARPDTNPYVAIIARVIALCPPVSGNMTGSKTPGIAPALFGLVHRAVGSKIGRASCRERV